MRMPTRFAGVGLILLSCGLSACGGSSSSTAADHTATLAPPVPPSTATVTRTVATPTTTTTATSASTACTASDLGLAFAGSNGAAGTIVIYLKVHNTGSTPCHTFGYPGVEFLAKDGAGLNTASTRTTHDVLGSVPETRIQLGPGQAASFRLAVSTVGGQGSCANAYGLQVIPPDDTATLRVAFPNGIFQCGRTTVSPLEPGTGAIPAGT